MFHIFFSYSLCILLLNQKVQVFGHTKAGRGQGSDEVSLTFSDKSE